MSRKIILATNNQHKVKEIQQIFGSGFQIVSLKEIGYFDDIIEDGATFIENSLIKCKAVYERFQLPVLADDSGLCVHQLGGRPGIHSARYGGLLTDRERYEKLLTEIDPQKDLTCGFVCALVLYINPYRQYIIQEEVTGEITFTPAGNNGFGYDPVFFLKDRNKTVAELSDEEKNAISHRGKAASMMKKILDSVNF